MINLIPPDARKSVQREYWVRVVSVWMMLLATACVMVAILQLPAYVLVQGQLATFEGEYEKASEQNESFKDSESVVKQANEVAVLLTRDSEVVEFSTLMEVLEGLSGAGVHLNKFEFARADGVIATIVVAGVSDSRVALADFRDSLEAHEYFESAELPLSNLAKDRDIPFNINIMPGSSLKE